MTDINPTTRQTIRAAISDAYYDARNAGHSMEMAADAAVENLTPIIASIDANANARGRALGGADALLALLDEGGVRKSWRDAVTVRIRALREQVTS